jgi:methionine sulfoxide reductase heme-binding subunit
MIRGTGTVAYILLYLTVIVGLFSQVQKKRKKKMTSAINLHEELSNWAMILVGGHLGLLLLDTYIGFKWTEVFVPFHTSYKSIPMALGTLSFYFLIITFITSKLRKKVGYLRWRKLHALNPILYILVTIHGLWIGTDFNPEIVAIANLVPFPIMGIFALLMKFTKAKPQPNTTRAAVTRTTRYTD